MTSPQANLDTNTTCGGLASGWRFFLAYIPAICSYVCKGSNSSFLAHCACSILEILTRLCGNSISFGLTTSREFITLLDSLNFFATCCCRHCLHFHQRPRWRVHSFRASGPLLLLDVLLPLPPLFPPQCRHFVFSKYSIIIEAFVWRCVFVDKCGAFLSLSLLIAL